MKPMEKKWKYFCRKYQKVLTAEELQNHGCFSKKKGRNKNKPCSTLYKISSEQMMGT